MWNYFFLRISVFNNASKLVLLSPSFLFIVRHFQILSDNLYVVHDDMDLPIGKFQLKESGSAG